ncbi:endolytic transglycosylase MltG [Gracilimonas sp. Q87]|uniref:endolytic transglycosylase MltG n=1 Tax=Gracilimonas sp. Q87 TaxID=3384766 RepID=UPI00398407B7
MSRAELIVALTIFLLVMGSVMTSRLTRLSGSEAIAFDSNTVITFTELSGLDELEKNLDTLNVDYDSVELKWAATLLGWRKFQRGRYEFEGLLSYNAFLSKMTRGIQDPVEIVILPGITVERFSSTIAEKLHFNEDDLLQVFSDSTYLSEKGFTEEELFGRMLPDTYSTYWTRSPRQIVNLVLREFKSKVETTYQSRLKELEYSANQIVTLASIVEWEAKNSEEKPIISGLYWNRLKKGMLLQADPTVNYALGERRRLLFEDYLFDHPYNTYVNRGLPPGPITNPSLSTIEATLFPVEHDYLYMVANPEGGHVFTKTFQEHRRESEKWRIWLREQYRIKRQQEAQQKDYIENKELNTNSQR